MQMSKKTEETNRGEGRASPENPAAQRSRLARIYKSRVSINVNLLVCPRLLLHFPQIHEREFDENSFNL